MWQSLTLQRPKLREKQARSNLAELEKSKLRRAKTFCDNFNERSITDGKSNQRTWLKNIKNWKKRFMKNEYNFNDDLDMKARSVSKESLDKIR